MALTIWTNQNQVRVVQLSDAPEDGTAEEQIAHLGTLDAYAGWTCVAHDYTDPFPDTDASLWRWESGAVVTSLSSRKEQKREAINAERNQREVAGFLYNGKLFDSDQRSADRIQIAAIAAQAALSGGQPFSIDWTCADNTIMTLDAQGMLGLAAAFANYGASLHETARVLKAQVEAATTAAEVEAITWP